MGSAQLILLAGGLILLGAVSLTIYNSFNNKTDFELQNEAYITAASIGQSMIDKILTKSFDQKTVSHSYTVPDSLTSVGLLGPDAGETSVTSYNDIDDYKNYVQLDTLSVLGVFRTKIDINYAQKFNPDITSNARTFTKRIDVFVTNTFLKDTLKLNYGVTY